MTWAKVTPFPFIIFFHSDSLLLLTPRFKMKLIDCRKISLHQRRVSEAGDILTA